MVVISSVGRVIFYPEIALIRIKTLVPRTVNAFLGREPLDAIVVVPSEQSKPELAIPRCSYEILTPRHGNDIRNVILNGAQLARGLYRRNETGIMSKMSLKDGIQAWLVSLN